ncbi:MAG: molecular chaperone TorD family protein [Dechloromonas sp.]|nr:molecular chaperone TorD family protein [Dechloromonas sp.]
MEAELRAAIVEDLDQLIRLHDRELDAETLVALKQADFPRGLAMFPVGQAGSPDCAKMAAAFRESISLDELAADYAAIYLNNHWGASPYESVWLSDDHLACASPMFELREIYAVAGFRAADWRRRFDDHLVLQLQYVRQAVADLAVDPKKTADFIDEHIGYWFPDFAQRVSMKCGTAFYAALAELTHVWLIRFRELLCRIHSLPVPSREQISQRISRKLALGKADVAPIKFMPGAQGASW